MHINKLLFAFLTILIASIYTTNAQSLSAFVIDSVSQQPIPYATVQLKEKGVITNEEGNFNFILNETIKETDSLIISSMGYETLTKPISEFTPPMK